MTGGFRVEAVHTEENDPRWNMPYTPAIKVYGGATIWVAGVTAGLVYHSHPHVDAEFDSVPDDPGEQAEVAMDNLEAVLAAAGATLADLVRLDRFIVDIERNQDAINAVMSRRLPTRPTSTSVGVARLAGHDRMVLELTAVAAVPD